MKQRAFLAIGTIVLCAGLLAGCGKVTKSVEINYGETYKIEDEKLEGKENLTWESADAEIVEVADDGTVTAKAPGKAKVAIKENGKSVGEYCSRKRTIMYSVEVRNGLYDIERGRRKVGRDTS